MRLFGVGYNVSRGNDYVVAAFQEQAAAQTLSMEATYHRDYYWSKEQVQLFLHSLFNRLYQEPIILDYIDDDRQEVVDGKQRIKTLFDFTNGHVPVFVDDDATRVLNPDEINQFSKYMYWNDFSEEEQLALRSWAIPIERCFPIGGAFLTEQDRAKIYIQRNLSNKTLDKSSYYYRKATKVALGETE